MHACTVEANHSKKNTKEQKSQLLLLKSWEQKAGYHALPLYTTSPKGWTNQLSHPSIPLDTPLLSPHIRNKLTLPSVSKQAREPVVCSPSCCSTG